MCYQVYAQGTTGFFFLAFEICDVKCYVILTSTLNALTTRHVESLKTKAKLETHCIGKSNVIYERYKFNNHSQQQTEWIDVYVNALGALAETCDFGALKDQLIRDRIVCGVRDNAVRRKLLQESKLALKNVLTFVVLPKPHLHSSKKWHQTNNNNIPVMLIWSPKDICGNQKHIKKM